MKRIGTIKLYPTSGKVVNNCFVNHNNETLQVNEVFENGTIRLSNGMLISRYDCRLLKYYLVYTKDMAEVHYSDYDKVELDKRYSADVTSIANTANIGDKVTIFKLDCNTIEFNQPLPGIIVNVVKRIYEVHLLDGTVVHAKRHYFRLNDKPNDKYIARILAIVQKPIKHGLKEQLC